MTDTATPVATQQAGQSALLDGMAGPLDVAFGFLDPTDPASVDQYITAVTALVTHYGKASAAAAAAHYDAERQAAKIPGRYTVRVAPPADPAKINISVRWATKDLWSPQPDLEATRTKLAGVAEKNVLDTGRDTTLDAVGGDRKARGYARQPEPGACAFCALLATRGAVYKEHSFDKANAKFVGDGKFKTHDHCRCTPRPVFGVYEPSAQIRQWQQIYQESTKGVRGAKKMRAAFRQALGDNTPQ